MSLCGALATPWSLPLGGQIRMKNIEDGGEERAEGVRRKHLLICLILKLHRTICMISSLKKRIREFVETPSGFPPNSWLHIILNLQHQGAHSVCFGSENLSIFLSAAGSLFRALQHHTGGSLIVKALPERAITPDSPAHHRTRNHQAAAFGSSKEREGFGKYKTDGTGSIETYSFTHSMLERPDLLPPPSSSSSMRLLSRLF